MMRRGQKQADRQDACVVMFVMMNFVEERVSLRA